VLVARRLKRSLPMLTAALTLSAASAAGLGIIPPSTVTIKSKGLLFHGKVQSQTRGCQINREVRLYRQLGGHKQLQGSDTTRKLNGHWVVEAQGTAGASMGSFYAKVLAGALSPQQTLRACQPARSATIRVSGP
jgi:hypothetical protein